MMNDSSSLLSTRAVASAPRDDAIARLGRDRLGVDDAREDDPVDVESPLISVLTPSYNYARFLPDALLSVLGQKTQHGAEHVVVDDGSTDDTSSLLRAWPDRLVFSTRPHEGQSAALNAALKLAKGDWIGWLNGDDFYLPGALAAVERAVERAEADVVHGDSVLVDQDGRVLRLISQHPLHRGTLKRYGPTMGVGGVFMRREALPADPWDTSLDFVPDLDLWLRLAATRARFVYVPYPFSANRWHPSQLSQKRPPHYRDAVAARYGLPPGGKRLVVLRRAGHAEHAVRKLLAGGYGRQRRVKRELAGADIRWFADSRALDSADRLVALATGAG